MKICNKNLKKIGFTLVELLVSLGILGLIATLTLPQLYINQDRIMKQAVFKEAYYALATATKAVADEGGYTYDIIPKLNTTKVCLNHSDVEGCAPAASDLAALNFHAAGVPSNINIGTREGSQAGFILPSGVHIVGIGSPATIIASGGHKVSPTAPCTLDSTAPDTLWSCGDYVIIALEDFPKKEYFYVLLHTSDISVDFKAIDSSFAPFYSGTQLWMRPGEIKCVSQNCLDMFS
jgi:prepilin-type N-terminal cleavage/methylation domain-containing protein